MYSQERRMERYRILYVWKIIEGFSPNCGLEVMNSSRRGRKVKVPAMKGTGSIKSLREYSFQVHGPRLFNSLPRSIRELTRMNIEDFKSKLDKHLTSLPDEPKGPSYIPSTYSQVTGLPSNSIIDHSWLRI